MIITRTPYRISFFGGGTDYPTYYKNYGGAVLNTSINHYSHIMCRFLPPFFGHKYRIRYYKTEHTNTLNDIQHPVVRECLRIFGIERGIEMVHSGDIPAMTGIGSSSAFTVGFLHALHALTGKMIAKRPLAETAIRIEQDILQECVGSQDQIAAAFGGMNKIEFFPDGSFLVHPITTSHERLSQLNKSLLFFFTGLQREAHTVAADQIKRTSQNRSELAELHSLVDAGVSVLNSDTTLDDFGKLLNESWRIKKTLSNNISNGSLDSIYETAMRAGALGGKLCGAGGGGFFLFYVPEERKSVVMTALAELLHVPFKFDSIGSHVAFYSADNKGLGIDDNNIATEDFKLALQF